MNVINNLFDVSNTDHQKIIQWLSSMVEKYKETNLSTVIECTVTNSAIQVVPAVPSAQPEPAAPSELVVHNAPTIQEVPLVQDMVSEQHEQTEPMELTDPSEILEVQVVPDEPDDHDELYKPADEHEEPDDDKPAVNDTPAVQDKSDVQLMSPVQVMPSSPVMTTVTTAAVARIPTVVIDSIEPGEIVSTDVEVSRKRKRPRSRSKSKSKSRSRARSPLQPSRTHDKQYYLKIIKNLEADISILRHENRKRRHESYNYRNCINDLKEEILCNNKTITRLYTDLAFERKRASRF